MFWNMPSAAGIFGMPRRLLIDMDEAGFTLEKLNLRYGRALSGVCVNYASRNLLLRLWGVSSGGVRSLICPSVIQCAVP